MSRRASPPAFVALGSLLVFFFEAMFRIDEADSATERDSPPPTDLLASTFPSAVVLLGTAEVFPRTAFTERIVRSVEGRASNPSLPLQLVPLDLNSSVPDVGRAWDSIVLRRDIADGGNNLAEDVVLLKDDGLC